MNTPRVRLLLASSRAWDASTLQLALFAQEARVRDLPVSAVVPNGADAYWRDVAPDVTLSTFDTEARARVIASTLRARAESVRANVAVTDDEVLRRLLARTVAEHGCVLQRLAFGAAPQEASLGSRLFSRRVPSAYLLPTLREKISTAREPANNNTCEIPMAVSPREDVLFQAARETPVLVIVPHPEAPHESLSALRAAAQVAKRHAQLRIHLLGAPEALQPLRVHGAALQIASQLTTGPLGDGSRMLPVGTFAAWVIAEGDSGASVALHAMAQRVPLLLWAESTLMPLVEHGVTGCVLGGEGVLAESLAAAELARLIAHDNEQRALGGAARLRVQRLHGPERLYDAVLEAVTRVQSAARRAA